MELNFLWASRTVHDRAAMMPHSSPRSRRPVFTILESNPYLLVRHDPTRRLVLITRRPAAYPDIPTLHWAFDRIIASLDGVSRSDHRVIVDSRAALARNDEAFEAAMAVRRPEALRGFSRVVIMVRTVAGKLQIGRHAQADGMAVFICADLRELEAELGISVDETLLADSEAR